MTDVLLSFGHGYSAQALSRILGPAGWTVFGTTRQAETADSVAQSGAVPIIWPGADITPFLDQAEYLLISAGPNEAGDPVLKALKSEIQSRSDQFKWVGYLSTTGVYGDHQGAWIDETTPLTPATKRGKLRVKAERDWSATGVPLHIFRLAGIYGPGRGPFSKVHQGTARRIIKANQVFSRIHVDDIAQVLAASIARPNPGAVYNVCDDLPAPPQDVIAYAAELLDVPVPLDEDFETADMSPMARSFYSESKRVSNERLKVELGVTLKYPDYKTGLDALLKLEHSKG